MFEKQGSRSAEEYAQDEVDGQKLLPPACEAGSAEEEEEATQKHLDRQLQTEFEAHRRNENARISTEQRVEMWAKLRAISRANPLQRAEQEAASIAFTNKMFGETSRSHDNSKGEQQSSGAAEKPKKKRRRRRQIRSNV